MRCLEATVACFDISSSTLAEFQIAAIVATTVLRLRSFTFILLTNQADNVSRGSISMKCSSKGMS